MTRSFKGISAIALLSLTVGAGAVSASGSVNQTLRTGICNDAANADLRDDSVIASMCARKWEKIAYSADDAQQPRAAKAPVATVSTSGDETDISGIASVIQEIRTNRDEVAPATVTAEPVQAAETRPMPRPLPEIAAVDAPRVAVAQPAVQQVAYVRPASYQPQRTAAADTTTLSAALLDIRMAKLERSASPDKLWFVGVYR